MINFKGKKILAIFMMASMFLGSSARSMTSGNVLSLPPGGDGSQNQGPDMDVINRILNGYQVTDEEQGWIDVLRGDPNMDVNNTVWYYDEAHNADLPDWVSPLTLAVDKNWLMLAYELLQRGADIWKNDPNLDDFSWVSPMWTATGDVRKDMIELFHAYDSQSVEGGLRNQTIASEGGVDPITAVIENFYTDASIADVYGLVQLLVLYGAPINPVGKPSPLEAATENNDLHLVNYLLSLGANPNSTPGEHFPLEWAIENENLVLVSSLLRAGANPNAINPDEPSGAPIYAVEWYNYMCAHGRLAANPNDADLNADFQFHGSLVQLLSSHGGTCTYQQYVDYCNYVGSIMLVLGQLS